MKIKTIALTLLTICLGCTYSAKSAPDIKKRQPVIQLAILLDTSGSMDGLITQAKTQLWDIVNELATAEQDGQKPRIEVALYHYGNDLLVGGDNGWIKQLCPLTNDLDQISEKLFALTTNGGSEYCGQVISRSLKELKWSDSKKDLKLIYIAGNEPFTQGPINYSFACKKAISKGIVVNTIFCGNMQEGINSKWKDGAMLTGGNYLSINHNSKTIYMATPYDKKLAELGSKLNSTYISYGKRGKAKKMAQCVQDSNAINVNSSVMAKRAITKSTTLYNNSSWDLIDAIKDAKLDIEKIKKEELPLNMQKMTIQERKIYITKNSKERKIIQTEIHKLSIKRREFIKKNQKKNKGEKALNSAIIQSVREQAKKQSFKFKK